LFDEPIPYHLLYGLSASILYAIAAMFIKRTCDLKVGLWTLTFAANLTTGLAFALLLGLGGPGQPVSMLWQPALSACFFIIGQVFAFLAIQQGDVSIATPIFGTKIIFVAAIVTLMINEPVSGMLWLSAIMATVAVTLLNRGGAKGDSRKFFITVLLALTSSLGFSAFDVSVTVFAPAWGPGVFLPIMMGMVSLFSLGFLMKMTPLKEAVPKKALPWLCGAALFMALQAISIVYGLARFGDAPRMNIVYAARGVWSILLVWFVGHWFQNLEQNLGGRVMIWRLVGTLLLTAAIVMALVSGA
jgi:drug/metabolite transporter (DMT)-like permease